LNLGVEDIWVKEENEKNFWTAKLFPVFTLQELNDESPAFFLSKAITSVQSGNENISNPVTSEAVQQWKVSSRLSLADILSCSDYNGFLSWQIMLDSVYKLELHEHIENNSDLFQAIDKMVDLWRVYYLSCRSTASGGLTMEKSAALLLFFLCYSHFYSMEDLMNELQSRNKNSSPQKEVLEFLSAFLPSETNRLQIIGGINSFLQSFHHSISYDYSNKLQLFILFLQKLIVESKDLVRISLSLYEIGKCLPSSHQPRVLFLIGCLLNVKELCSLVDFSQFQSPSRDVMLHSIQNVNDFELKLQFLYERIFQSSVFDKLRNVVDVPSNSHKLPCLKGSPSLPSFIEDNTQLLIQYHLYLSIMENLHVQQKPAEQPHGNHNSSSSSSSLPSADYWMNYNSDNSLNRNKVVKVTSPVRIDLAGGWVRELLFFCFVFLFDLLLLLYLE
jgi:hypothetical protein